MNNKHNKEGKKNGEVTLGYENCGMTDDKRYEKKNVDNLLRIVHGGIWGLITTTYHYIVKCISRRKRYGN